MAKLVVRLNSEIVKEHNIVSSLTIGRDTGDIVLRNPAVSASHARIDVEKGHFILHDNKSTNGTFVNRGRISSKELHHGDLIAIGKFEIEFINAEEKPATFDLFGQGNAAGMTMMINTADLLKARAGKEGEFGKKAGPAQLMDITKSASSKGPMVSYRLDKDTTLIGSGANADVRVKGLTIGGIAAALRREGDKYSLKYMGGITKPKVNGEKVAAEVELKPKDRIEIGSHIFEFRV